MNTDKQDARNSIENSIYKTAFKLHSVQTLCQLDLINSSLIQQVLLYQGLGEMREKCLSTPQLFQALQDLFQRLEVKRPGWVSPRASELTLSLLTAMYDSTGTGFVKLIPTIAALIALSGDSPLTKYRENNRGGKDSGNRMTRRVLRNLLTDLQQIPTVVGESRALCSVESATRSCFRGVLSPAIKEEKFLSWLESEPLILLWLPTCYRLSATEMVTHPVRCRICSNFPVTGVRYSCVKCLNFDICQSCFLSDLHGKPHEKSYPAIQHCAQMSAKENTKLLVSSLRNKLLQRHWRRTEAARSRQWLLDQGNPKDIANQERVRRLFTRCTNPEVPIYVSSPGPAATKASKNVPEMTPQVQQTNHSSPHRQTIVSLKNELWRNREYIHALQKERRLLKKQLNRCKNKMQIISAFQEETSYRLETKILELKTNQETLWTKLQKMGQDLQAMLQPLYSSSSCQSTVSKTDDGKGERLLRRDSSEIRNISGGGSEKKYLSYPTLINRSHQSQANVDYALPNANFPEATLQSRSTQTTKVQNQEEKMWNEAISVLPSSHEGLSQTTHQITPADINNSPALTPVGRKETIHNQEGKDELEEEELNQLLSKLTDAFTLDMPSGELMKAT